VSDDDSGDAEGCIPQRETVCVENKGYDGSGHNHKDKSVSPSVWVSCVGHGWLFVLKFRLPETRRDLV
jgi:hypothetical protein